MSRGSHLYAGLEHTDVVSPSMYFTTMLHGASSLTQIAMLSASQMVHRLQRGQYKNVVNVSVVTKGVGRVAAGPCLSTSIIARVQFAAALGILKCLPYEDPSQIIQHRDIDPYMPNPMGSCHHVNDASKEALSARATMSQLNTIAIPFIQYRGVPIKEDMIMSTHQNASYAISGEHFQDTFTHIQ